MTAAFRQSSQFFGSILLAMCFGAGWSLAHVTTATAVVGAEVDTVWLVLGSMFGVGAVASVVAAVVLGRGGVRRAPLRLAPLGAALTLLGAAEFAAPVEALVHADPVVTTVAILLVQALVGVVCTVLGFASVRAGIALLRGGGFSPPPANVPSFALPSTRDAIASSVSLRALWARPPPRAA